MISIEPLTIGLAGLVALLVVGVAMRSWKSNQTWFRIAFYERKAQWWQLVPGIVLPATVIRWMWLGAVTLESLIALAAFYVSWAVMISVTGSQLSRGRFGTWAAFLGRFFSLKVQRITAWIVGLAWLPVVLIPREPFAMVFVVGIALIVAFTSWNAAIRATYVAYLLVILAVVFGSWELATIEQGGNLMQLLAIVLLPWVDIPLVHRINAAAFPEVAIKSLWAVFGLSLLVDVALAVFAWSLWEPVAVVTRLLIFGVTLAYVCQAIAATWAKDAVQGSWQGNGRITGFYRFFVIVVLVLTVIVSRFFSWPFVAVVGAASFWPWFLMWVAKKKLAASAALLTVGSGIMVGIVWTIFSSFPVVYPVLGVTGLVFLVQNWYVRRKIYGWK